MKAFRTQSALAAAAAVLGLAAVAPATVIREINFDDKVADSSQHGSYAEPTGMVTSSSIADPDGYSGNAGSMTFDATGQSDWSTVSGTWISDSGSGSVSMTGQSDFEISFAAKVVGLADGVTSTNATLYINTGAWPDQTFVLTKTGIFLTGDWATFTINVDDMTVSGNPFYAEALATTYTKFNLEIGGAPGYAGNAIADFGADAGNKIMIDNIKVSEVPEPAALALFGLVAPGILARRRRTA